jgi:hypothetical protein
VVSRAITGARASYYWKFRPSGLKSLFERRIFEAKRTKLAAAMSDTAVQTQDGASEQAVVPSSAGELASGQSGAVSFAELVRIHFEWERALQRGTPDEELEKRFRDKLEEFQKNEGTLLHAYWSRRRPSAVALTVNPRRRTRLWRRARGKADRERRSRSEDAMTAKDVVIRLHRATDWLARESRIADLLHHCDTLGIRVGEILRGTSERIAMQWIFAVQSHLLGFIERTEGKAKEEDIDAIVKAQEQELVQIEKYYDRAANKTARVVYFGGMMLGALYSAVLAGLGALALWVGGWMEQPHVHGIETFFVSYAAGGIGAIVSVMFRMANEDKFDIDYEVGRPTVRRLGAFRPFIGAIFGVAMYFLISSGLPQVDLPNDEQAFFYYGTVAFLAGFAERRTKVILGSAESTLEKSLGLGTGGDSGGTPSSFQAEGDGLTRPGAPATQGK